MPGKNSFVRVTGDYVLDHHIYEGRRRHFGDGRQRGVQVVEELGGAALVHRLLLELGGGVRSHQDVATDDRHRPSLPDGDTVPSHLRAFALWHPYRRRETDPDAATWQTKEALGFGCLPEIPCPFVWPASEAAAKRPDVIVLSDGGMGFREDPARWPAESLLKQARWIVLKSTHPLSEGRLWDYLSRPAFRSRLVVVLSAADLRKGSAWISSGLSWDGTVESVLSTLAPGGVHQALSRCRHLLVAFGSEGGLWIENASTFAHASAHLVYEAASIEGEHPQTGKGAALGALSCLTAAAAWHLARTPPRGQAPDLETALEGGLSAMRDLLDHGHGLASSLGAGFPSIRLAKVIRNATCRYSRARFAARVPAAASSSPSPHANPTAPRCWNLMYEALRQQRLASPEPAWVLAERVVRHGPVALGSLPHMSIGQLMSADVREIEALRLLRRLIVDYISRPAAECKKPLSLGVFGPPGSGKSFAVKEIAQTLVGKESWLEFNLSQFNVLSKTDLIGAFHQIRDRVLRAQVPVAFFDEFDSHAFAWLHFLLAPMQDGAFQEGQITHPLGKCIFIFAGGTSQTFESFGPPAANIKEINAFKLAKGPDFKSRLDGFLDILGPNRRELVTVTKSRQSYAKRPDPSDIFFPVRRAFVIRSEFRCDKTQKLDMDAGLLRAFLHANHYRHGTRSLGKLLEPLKAGLPNAVCRSLLPPASHINLHVNAAAFLKTGVADAPPPPLRPLHDLDRMAGVIHETYRQLGRSQGWLEPGNANDIPYRKLHAFYKRSNRAAATRMASTLALIGLRLAKGRNTPASLETVRLRIEYNLELLAEAEHAGWLKWHLDQGWQYAPEKPPFRFSEEPIWRTHPCLRPYLQLSDQERNKDRNSVRHYLLFAQAAGLKIVDAIVAQTPPMGHPADGSDPP